MHWRPVPAQIHKPMQCSLEDVNLVPTVAILVMAHLLGQEAGLAQPHLGSDSPQALL